MADEPVNGEAAPAAAGDQEQAVSTVSEEVASPAKRLTDWFDSREWLPEGLEEGLALTVLLIGLIATSVFIYVVVRPLVLRGVKSIIKRTAFVWDDKLFGFGVFRWASHFVPAMLIYSVTPGLFESAPKLAAAIVGASQIYMVVAGFFMVDSILNLCHAAYQKTDLARKIPADTFLQVGKLLAALVALILVLAVVIGRSPLVLLGGLGVFASVLMLIFKDVILGLVAGIQIASNQMLLPGDWLQMPGQGADGDVEEIGLTTVRVRNFDKTYTNIPTYALISQSFKNWRGMTESGGRRIKRSLLIDVNSIRLCDEAMLKRFREIEHIEAYLKQKEEEIADWNEEHGVSGEQDRVNGRRLTNVGTFRAYIEAYLRNHPKIQHEGMTLLVRQLAPEARGLPIEVYCFTTTTAWADYEGIQADIFDHLFAVAPEFDLRVFQQPSGADVRDPIAIMRAESEG